MGKYAFGKSLGGHSIQSRRKQMPGSFLPIAHAVLDGIIVNGGQKVRAYTNRERCHCKQLRKRD